MKTIDTDNPVRSLREALDLSTGELALLLGMTSQAVSQAERRGAGISVRWFARAAEACGVRLVCKVTDDPCANAVTSR